MSLMTEAFVARCEELGMTNNLIKQAVAKLCTVYPDLANELTVIKVSAEEKPKVKDLGHIPQPSIIGADSGLKPPKEIPEDFNIAKEYRRIHKLPTKIEKSGPDYDYAAHERGMKRLVESNENQHKADKMVRLEGENKPHQNKVKRFEGRANPPGAKFDWKTGRPLTEPAVEADKPKAIQPKTKAAPAPKPAPVPQAAPKPVTPQAAPTPQAKPQSLSKYNPMDTWLGGPALNNMVQMVNKRHAAGLPPPPALAPVPKPKSAPDPLDLPPHVPTPAPKPQVKAPVAKLAPSNAVPQAAIAQPKPLGNAFMQMIHRRLKAGLPAIGQAPPGGAKPPSPAQLKKVLSAPLNPPSRAPASFSPPSFSPPAFRAPNVRVSFSGGGGGGGHGEHGGVSSSSLAPALIGGALGLGALGLGGYGLYQDHKRKKEIEKKAVIANALSGANDLMDKHPLATMGLSVLPVTGTAINAAQTAGNFHRGEIAAGVGNALGTAASVIPGVSLLAKGVRTIGPMALSMGGNLMQNKINMGKAAGAPPTSPIGSVSPGLLGDLEEINKLTGRHSMSMGQEMKEQLSALPVSTLATTGIGAGIGGLTGVLTGHAKRNAGIGAGIGAGLSVGGAGGNLLGHLAGGAAGKLLGMTPGRAQALRHILAGVGSLGGAGFGAVTGGRLASRSMMDKESLDFGKLLSGVGQMGPKIKNVSTNIYNKIPGGVKAKIESPYWQMGSAVAVPTAIGGAAYAEDKLRGTTGG